MDAGDNALARREAMQMHHALEAGEREGVHGMTIQPRRDPQRLESGRNIGGGVRMDRAAPALVPGVQGGEQIDDLGTTHLTDDDAVRSHAQPSTFATRACMRTACG